MIELVNLLVSMGLYNGGDYWIHFWFKHQTWIEWTLWTWEALVGPGRPGPRLLQPGDCGGFRRYPKNGLDDMSSASRLGIARDARTRNQMPHQKWYGRSGGNPMKFQPFGFWTHCIYRTKTMGHPEFLHAFQHVSALSLSHNSRRRSTQKRSQVGPRVFLV